MAELLELFEDVTIRVGIDDESGETRTRLQENVQRLDVLTERLRTAVFKSAVYFSQSMSHALLLFVRAPWFASHLANRVAAGGAEVDRAVDEAVRARDQLRELFSQVSSTFRSLLGVSDT